MPENVDYTRRRRIGAGMVTRGCVGPVARVSNSRRAPISGAQRLRRHKFISCINTNISLHSAPRKNGSGGLGYSDSVVQYVGLTLHYAGHHRQLCCGLRALRQGGIDLLAGLRVGGGLNSSQINHLQQNASEAHYRGLAPGPRRPACTSHILHPSLQVFIWPWYHSNDHLFCFPAFHDISGIYLLYHYCKVIILL